MFPSADTLANTRAPEAVHQAAQAVVAAALDLPLDRLDIDGEDGAALDLYAARTILSKLRGQAARAYAMKICVALIVGEFTEAIFKIRWQGRRNAAGEGLAVPVMAGSAWDSASDYVCDLQVALNLDPKQIAATAFQGINEKWSAIFYLAEILVERQQMSVVEVRAAIAGHTMAAQAGQLVQPLIGRRHSRRPSS